MEAGAAPRALRPVSCLLSQQHSHPGHVLYGSGPDTGVVAGALEVLTPSVLLPDSATCTISQKEGKETPANPLRAHGSPVPVTRLLRPEVAPLSCPFHTRPRRPTEGATGAPGPSPASYSGPGPVSTHEPPKPEGAPGHTPGRAGKLKDRCYPFIREFLFHFE